MHKLSMRVIPGPSSVVPQKFSPTAYEAVREWIAGSKRVFIQEGERNSRARLPDQERNDKP